MRAAVRRALRAARRLDAWAHRDPEPVTWLPTVSRDLQQRLAASEAAGKRRAELLGELGRAIETNVARLEQLTRREQHLADELYGVAN
jgi:hypothetical protein